LISTVLKIELYSKANKMKNWYKKAQLINDYQRTDGGPVTIMQQMDNTAVVVFNGQEIDRFDSVEEAQSSYPGEETVYNG
jgi:hypothetical protein